MNFLRKVHTWCVALILFCGSLSAQQVVKGKYDRTTLRFVPKDTAYKITAFHDGHAIASKNNRHLIIDTLGRVTIIDVKKPQVPLMHLSNQLLRMTLSGPTWGGVNSTCNGFEGGTYVICNLKGELVVPLILASLPFDLDDHEPGLIYFYESEHPATAGDRFRARTMKCVMCNACYGHAGIIDTTGKVIVKWDRYYDIGEFHNGLARVVNDSLVGFINRAGEEVIACQFISARSFEGGLATVQNGRTYGAIDTTGTFVIPAVYRNEFKFEEGKALVLLDKERFYINTKGERLPQ